MSKTMLSTQQKAQAKQIQEILDALYPNPCIPLLHTNAYTLLIAVVLSAQCTDLRVNQITPLLFAKANDPQAMAALSCDEISQIIRPCGLSLRKAKAIRQLSIDIVCNHKGKVPNTFEELEQLPGVGHKTASVVMSQAFGLPTFPVDTHIHRCAQRWGLSNGKNVLQTEHDLKILFPIECWNKIHLQMIYFARQYCSARGHKVPLCPICSQLAISPSL